MLMIKMMTVTIITSVLTIIIRLVINDNTFMNTVRANIILILLMTVLGKVITLLAALCQYLGLYELTIQEE